ncbi:conjugal transfer protein [Allonocardiopsis opalescens]|uniref:Conjugative transposon protein TcpC n=1 Tax=Allonocardiopsis opalescens TaxID=1144618 RepID=A0A2T0QDI2_9ACTN|nr:conjugal transfer protein [Allonocardiopsis opalescens]PRY01931.1 conjugative transposon protein TcpC [Allonocardiopsis opalescens]
MDVLDAPPARRRRGWSGGGGRWLIWLGRAVLWIFIIVVIVNGVRAPFTDATAGPPEAAPEQDPAGSFPESGAAAFALQFADVYLNFDGGSAEARAEALAAYLPPETDTQAGWNGAGRLRADNLRLAGVDVVDERNAVVNLVASLGGEPVRLAVPVYTENGGFTVSGRPALLAAPPAAELPEVPAPEPDLELEEELTQVLTGFFPAYASGDPALDQYLDVDAAISGLNGVVEFQELADINVPAPGTESAAPDGAVTVTATVVWRPAAATEAGGEMVAEEPALSQTYRLTMVDGDRWYIRDIQASPQSFGS